MGYIPDAVGMSIMFAAPVVMVGSIVGVELWDRYAGRRELDKIIAEKIIENNMQPPYSNNPRMDRIFRRALRRNGYDPDNPQLGVYHPQ